MNLNAYVSCVGKFYEFTLRKIPMQDALAEAREIGSMLVTSTKPDIWKWDESFYFKKCIRLRSIEK